MNILFPHHVGHYIGLDVHDCPGYPRSYALKAGQCITVEPYVLASFHNNQPMLMFCYSGIYVPDSDRWPEKFRGIGIRIEDSVCVGDEHPIVLTPEAVKEVCLRSSLTPRNCELTCYYRSMTLRPCEGNIACTIRTIPLLDQCIDTIYLVRAQVIPFHRNGRMICTE